mmetsp:Transcript_34122/g.62048  ORF Transcript_34122/g.62048 Transcript_34122/m.62048 type:complete len:88 (-) Transcript_34122:1111-1374(-)
MLQYDYTTYYHNEQQGEKVRTTLFTHNNKTLYNESQTFQSILSLWRNLSLIISINDNAAAAVALEKTVASADERVPAAAAAAAAAAS